ncbi:oxygen-independent coproporphyrinogen III oxidase hemN [Candidatus Kinetoplastibacterium oncopeltii TCC290E]|uniref:Heme chaperone HemW n=2 Tax=Candidatus Kinetoplastidibacterium stringomonadis TaxID=994696 RepID=M1LYY6_9PROT|nr:radical SAM family heme chaperone HemW [Candidatus Kinetoplastibacterium oncopeltii]AEM25262.1 oxygen-independent coproporphyrinogen III oxidase [Candidatus Kinetoplastibacterium oncopeltii]AGF48349.1 oxygen-independent coproporphyrinogen III oxidase hemN [Candidatus Kinetoplastibacterium oncopeltii TCC290E]
MITIPIKIEEKKNNINSDNIVYIKNLPPLSIYIHIPWCVSKCPYCDFNSHSIDPNSINEIIFLESLRCDLEQSIPLIWNRSIISVFIGGGTPSILSVKAIDKILEMLRTYLKILPNAELTIEINPGTVDSSKMKGFKDSGINRFSIGIQSFDNDNLKKIGRIHDGLDALKSIASARYLLENINIDIMFSLPGQTISNFINDLKIAKSFDTKHLSIYHLTIEPNTLFSKNLPIDLPDEETSSEMEDLIESELKEIGMRRYEISAYSKDRFKSIHNLNYWTFGDYLGIGPGAHSKISFHNRIIRQKRIYNPKLWMNKAIKMNNSHVIEDICIPNEELPFEFMLNALRLKDGVSRQLFKFRTGLSIDVMKEKLNIAYKKKLLSEDNEKFIATHLGWKFLNDLQVIFIK